MANPDFSKECAKYPVGTRVVYGVSMRQAVGPAGKRWNAIVIGYSENGNFLVLDEASGVGYSEAEIDENPLLAYRHISPFAVKKAR